MATKKSSVVIGAKELNAVLKALSAQLQKNALAATAMAGAKVVQKRAYTELALAMRSRTPRADDVLVKRRRGEKGSVAATVEVGPPTRLPWLRWLHDGTVAHPIGAQTKFGTRRGVVGVAYGQRTTRRSNNLDNGAAAAQVLANPKTGEVFGAVVQHPGQPARPWLQIAYWRTKREALEAMAEKMADALQKQAKRLASGKFTRQASRRIARRRVA